MSLGDAIRVGGAATMLTLGAAGFVQALDQAGFAVLSPNIQKAFHVSDSVIAVIGSAFGVLFVLVRPAGQLHFSRRPLRT